MNIVPLGNIMAERYLYIPGAGFSMIAASFFSKRQVRYTPGSGIHSNTPLPVLFVFILFFILLGNAYLTFKRNNDWKDGLWLWSNTTLTSPNSFRAHINLGNAYEKKDSTPLLLKNTKKHYQSIRTMQIFTTTLVFIITK